MGDNNTALNMMEFWSEMALFIVVFLTLPIWFIPFIIYRLVRK